MHVLARIAEESLKIVAVTLTFKNATNSTKRNKSNYLEIKIKFLTGLTRANSKSPSYDRL